MEEEVSPGLPSLPALHKTGGLQRVWLEPGWRASSEVITSPLPIGLLPLYVKYVPPLNVLDIQEYLI